MPWTLILTTLGTDVVLPVAVGASFVPIGWYMGYLEIVKLNALNWSID